MAKQATKEKALQGAPRVNWDYSSMRSSYANVCNAQGSREEVTLFFGITHPSQEAGEGEINVQLSERVILSPFAAKRLATLLNAVVEQYESRFGSLGAAEGVTQAPASTTRN